jgi:DNA-binding transcriptional ArsR family regulator
MSQATVYRALGDETRLELVSRLTQGPKSMTELSEGLPITRQAVAKHLFVLEEAGLAHGRQQGRARIWVLQPAKLKEAQRYLDQISAEWDRALDRLKRFVED